MTNTQNKYNFTDQQQSAYEKLIAFNSKPIGGQFLIEGFAGTGKTYLVGRYAQELVDCGRNVAITAPTNKAVRVLFNETAVYDSRLKFATIHSLLGLSEHIDGYGKVKFLPDKKRKNKITEFDFLFIDEVSMLDDDLFALIQPYITKQHLHVVYLGDPCQIPPINKLDCIPFREDQRQKYKIDRATLTQIIRQDEDNPIIKKTFEIRNNIDKCQSFNSLTSEFTKSGFGVTFLHNKINQDDLLTLINTLFTSPLFKKDPDYAKIIAWHNDVVNTYNDVIRLFLYGGHIGKLVVGEKLIMDAPIVKDEKMLLYTNDEVTVDRFVTLEEFINKGKVKIKYYKADVSFVNIEGKSLHTTLKIIHEDSDKAFESYIQSLKKAALSEKQGTVRAKSKWIEYYHSCSEFAKVKYNYAITSHKSQGSTYTNTIVIDNDINSNPNIIERNRIKYTACSRPRQNLYVVL